MIKNILKIVSSFILICLFPISIFAAPQQKPLRVMLDWFVNPDHAPLFVAEQQDFYKKHGIQVQFIPPADPADTVKLVAARQADIGITYEPQFMLQVANGLPLVKIGTLVAMPLDCMVTLKNGPIHSISDLKGKRIGYSSAGTGNVMLKTMLEHNGLSLNDVKLINVHYGLTQALLAEKIDAFTGAMRNFEPIEMALAGKPARIFYPEENGMPLYDELIFVANPNEKNDPRIKAFLQAVQDGVVYLINHPNSTWDTFARNHPELNNKLNHMAWFATIPRFALRPALNDQTRYDNYWRFLQKNGFIK